MAKKGIVFNETEYLTLNDLGNAFAQNFELAINFVMDNTKKFIKFIRKIDKSKAKEVADIITTCKYQNNVITFIIYLFCDDKKVVINGQELTFKAFIKELGKYREKHLAFIAFMDDLGITRTYANIENNQALKQDAYYLDRSIRDPFTLEYLVSYYQYNYAESLESLISNIYYEEEKFRSALKVVKTLKFQLILAHKVGFKNVYKMNKERCPLFEACKLLQPYLENNDLIKLTENTFYWWLLDRYVIYVFSKKTNYIKKKLQDLSKKYKKEYSKYKFEQKMGFAKELYLVYLEFVDAYKNSEIKVNKKSDENLFVLDNPYCDTFICHDYMRLNVVKLQTEFDEVSESTYIEVDDKYAKNPKYAPKKIHKQETLIYKLRRFASFSSLFTFIFMLFTIVAWVLPAIKIDGVSLGLANQISLINLIISVAAFVLVFILGIILKIRGNKTLHNLNTFKLIRKFKTATSGLSAKEEMKLEVIGVHEDIYAKKGMRGHRIISLLILVLSSCTFVLGTVGLVSIISSFADLIPNWETTNTDTFRYILLGIGGGFGLLYGLIRKRKGAFTSIFVLLICILAVVICGLVM